MSWNKITMKGCCGLTKFGKHYFKSHLSSVLLRKRVSVCVFVAEISQANLPAPHLQERKVCMCGCVSSHICVSTAGWASCPISVRPDMIRRQIVSSSALSGPWRFCSEVRKGLNADIVQHCLWYPGTAKIQNRWKQASTNPAVEAQTLGNITLNEKEDCCCTKGGREVKWASIASVYGNTLKGT